VYTVASGQGQLVRRTFTGSAVTSSDTAPAGPGWAGTVGAFMVDGVLYTATGDGRLTEQTFDGSSYGPPSAVDAADQIVPQTDWHHGDVPLITSLFYADGRVYFTKSNSSYLYYRGFEPESGVVGQQRFALAAPAGSSSMYSTMRGAFVADGRLYFATSTGRLYGVDWSRAGASGTPVQVSGPGIDAESWSSAVMFPYQAG
jgi:outer membrane protein assembly factor BamB